LILLHQQFHQISLLVGIEHARQRGRGITGVPIAQIRLSWATLPEEGVVVTKPAMPHMAISLSNKY
jgi:hypothetical protein